MDQVFEFASFTVRNGHEAALLAERPTMIDALRANFAGVLAAWLTRRDDGSWLDVILWRSRAEAQAAAEQINTVPAATAWFAHIEESQGVHHVAVGHQHLFLENS
jgi:hypothetical protein